MLVKCPDCGNQVSTKARACPKCGCPVESKSNTNIQCPDCGQEVSRDKKACSKCGCPIDNNIGMNDRAKTRTKDKEHGYVLATVGDRFLAFLLDSLFVSFFFIPAYGITYVLLDVLLVWLWLLHINLALYSETFLLAICISIPATVINMIIYWRKGTSWGKRRMNLVIVNKDTEKPLSFRYMFLREVVGHFISGLALSIGYIWILLDRDRQGWHDKMCSSVVVKDEGSLKIAPKSSRNVLAIAVVAVIAVVAHHEIAISRHCKFLVQTAVAAFCE